MEDACHIIRWVSHAFRLVSELRICFSRMVGDYISPRDSFSLHFHSPASFFVGRFYQRKIWREKTVQFWKTNSVKFLDSESYIFRIANRSKWNWTRTSPHLAESNVLDTSMPHPTAEERKKLEHLENRERPGPGIPVSVTLFLRFRKSRPVFAVALSMEHL